MHEVFFLLTIRLLFKRILASTFLSRLKEQRTRERTPTDFFITDYICRKTRDTEQDNYRLVVYAVVWAKLP